MKLTKNTNTLMADYSHHDRTKLMTTTALQSTLPEQPENAGQRWTHEEEQQLIESVLNGVSLKELSERHMRTIGGLGGRLALLLFRKASSVSDVLLTPPSSNCQTPCCIDCGEPIEDQRLEYAANMVCVDPKTCIDCAS